jgi:hypothetical protein
VKKARISAISAEQDDWTRRAYAASVAAAKDLVGDQGPIRSNIAIGRLDDSAWGWVASAVIWGWVSTRAQQAASEGWSLEETVCRIGLEPCPWDTGGIIGILPKLAEACPDFDWSQPASAWSKETLAGFLLAAFNLIQRAMIARDVVEERLAGKPINAEVTARQVNAAAGNPLMTPDELKSLNNGDCSF